MATGNPTIARAAAAELPLGDALALTLLPPDPEPELCHAVALRWIGRLSLEAREVGLAGAQVAIGALVSIGQRDARAGAVALQALAEAHGRVDLADGTRAKRGSRT